MRTRVSRAVCALGLVTIGAGCSLPGYRFEGRFPDVVDGGARPDIAPQDVADASMIETDGAVLPDAGDAATDATMDATMDATDVVTDTPTDVSLDVSFDAQLVDVSTTCNPAVMPSAPALFVDPDAAPGGDGSAASPFRTISQAIAAANGITSGMPTIYLAPAIYAGSLRITDTARAMRITGGFSPTGASWSRNCTLATNAWLIGGNVEEAVRFSTNTGLVELERVAIQTRAMGAVGTSQYGVFVTGTGNAELQFVSVVAGIGGAGAPGMAGADGAGVVACDRVVCDRTMSGAAGVSGGGGGARTTPGDFTNAGFSPGNGAPGTDGSPGFAGGPGGAGTLLMPSCASCEGDVCDTVCAGMMQPGCGGRPQRACVTNARTLRGTDGQCGCGGAPGRLGQGGGGGGASVAVFVAAGGRLAVRDSSLQSSDGGAGAAGGNGGNGAAGASGMAGTPQSCNTRCSAGWSVCNCTTDSSSMVTANGGSMGGAGGRGGSGGRGGNGAGGSSYALVHSTTATVSLDRVVLVAGNGGVGGSGGSATGATGASGMRQMY